MAIPSQYSTPHLDAIELVVADEGDAIFKYPSPTNEQYMLIGKYVHSYNYIDLNVRRCVETFAYADMIQPPPKKGYRRIHPSELVPTVISVVEKMSPDLESVENTLAGLKTIEKFRDHRNILAHFGARQIPGTDTLIFLSKDNKDYKQVYNEDIPEQGMMRSLMPAPNLMNLLKHIAHCDEWFAHKTSEWIERYHPKAS